MTQVQIVYILHLISYIAIGIAIASVPFLIYNWVDYTAAKKREEDSSGIFVAVFPIKSVGFFIGPVITGIICGAIITYIGTNSTFDFLNSLSGQYSVKVNDTKAENPEQLVAELKRVGHISAHHSHPTKIIRIEIESSKGRMLLHLRRDSDTPREYWVFNPAFDDMNEIGRLNTTVLDQY